jgi:hypothetical protein
MRKERGRLPAARHNHRGAKKRKRKELILEHRRGKPEHQGETPIMSIRSNCSRAAQAIALLAATWAASPGEAAIVTAEFEVDLTSFVDNLGPAGTFLGIPVPSLPATTTGTLTYDDSGTFTDSGLIAGFFPIWVWTDSLGASSRLTLDLGGSIISTELGTLDLVVVDQSLAMAPSIWNFGVDLTGLTGTGDPIGADGSLFVDNVDSGIDGRASLAFFIPNTDLPPSFTDLSQIDIGAFIDSALLPGNEFEWIIGGNNGDTLTGSDVREAPESTGGGNAVVPEPATLGLVLLGLLAAVSARSRRRRR